MIAYFSLLCLLSWWVFSLTSTTGAKITLYSKTSQKSNAATNYFKTMELHQIRTNQDWHDHFSRRRERLKWRLQMAEAAEWNWPSTRARCEVMRIEEEIRRLDEEEFVVPNFTSDYSCA